MTKKIGDKKKIAEVKSTQRSGEVTGAEAVSSVDKVKPTQAVSGVTGAGAIRKRGATRIYTSAEREELMRIVEEEANSLALPPEKKQVVVKAVKMALDSGITDEADLTGVGGSSKPGKR